MKERLQKILSSRGLASRRNAEQWIADGRVSVNGLVAQLGQSADPSVDEISIDGKPLPAQQQRVYIMLNKPRGYVTTLSDEKGRQNAAQLVADCGTRVYPVGRLDMDSEGLLLFTNDGDFANRLMHPGQEVEKTYEVWITGYHEATVPLLRRPIEIDGYRIKPPKVKLIRFNQQQAKLLITIHEGRNRQVRRMCDFIGFPVRELKRTKMANLTINGLGKGRYRELSEQELAELKKAARL